MKETAVKIEDLGKRYRIAETISDQDQANFPKITGGRKGFLGFRKKESLWALRNISLEVGQGEVVGIIGRNGAGKSTLLKILSRITKPTEGKASVRGRVGSLLEVGTAFHPELTGRENVFLNGAILGMARREINRKFDDIVAFAETEAFIDTPVKYYSTGMHVRLAFAVAAHLDAEIMIVDEVLAVGDYKFQRKCLEKIREVSTTGETVILVSHNMSAIRSLSQRVFWLDRGELKMSGPADECVNAYVEANSQASQAQHVELTDTPRPIGQGEGFRFTSLALDMSNGDLVQSGSRLGVKLDFLVRKPIRELVVGISMHAQDGTWVLQALNTDSAAPFPQVKPGKYSLNLIFESLVLTPGRYMISAGARSSTEGLDWVREVMVVEVVDAEERDDWLAPTNGFVRLPSRFGPLVNVDPVVSEPTNSPLL